MADNPQNLEIAESAPTQVAASTDEAETRTEQGARNESLFNLSEIFDSTRISQITSPNSADTRTLTNGWSIQAHARDDSRNTTLAFNSPYPYAPPATRLDTTFETAAAQRSQPQADSRALQEFRSYLEAAAKLTYDPVRFGNINEIINRHGKDIRTSEDAIKIYKKVLKDAGDPQADVYAGKRLEDLTRQMEGHFGGIGAELFVKPTKQDPETAKLDPFKTYDFELQDEKKKDDKAKNGDKADDVPKGHPIIRKVYENTPAYEAGLRPGDAITKIDGNPTSGQTLEESIAKIRGKVNSDFVLTINRDGKEVEVPITRRDITIPAATAKMLDDGNLYIKISTFSNSKLHEQLQKIIAENRNAKGYIVDLRSNPGGLITEGIHVASMFMDKGTVLVQDSRIASDPKQARFETIKYELTRDSLLVSVNREGSSIPQLIYRPRGGEAQRIRVGQGRELDIPSTSKLLIGDKPVSILTNPGSASASEIVAGTVRNNANAFRTDNLPETSLENRIIGVNYFPQTALIGSRTFGKGTVQSVMSGDGTFGNRVKVTSGRYYIPDSPGGRGAEQKLFWPGPGTAEDSKDARYGIKPDLEVLSPKGTEIGSADDIKLRKAQEYNNKYIQEYLRRQIAQSRRFQPAN